MFRKSVVCLLVTLQLFFAPHSLAYPVLSYSGLKQGMHFSPDDARNALSPVISQRVYLHVYLGEEPSAAYLNSLRKKARAIDPELKVVMFNSEACHQRGQCRILIGPVGKASVDFYQQALQELGVDSFPIFLADETGLPNPLSDQQKTNSDASEQKPFAYAETLSNIATLLDGVESGTEFTKRLKNRLRSESEQWIRSAATNRLSQYGTVGFDLSLDSNFSVQSGAIDLLMPFTDCRAGNDWSTWFVQPGIVINSQDFYHKRHFVHAGIGYRYAKDDKLYGWNAFYDYDLTRHHQRASLGVEYAWRNILLAGNYYFPLSGWRSTPDNFPELAPEGWLQGRPAKGLDLTFSGALPRLPGFSVNASYQQFFGNDIEVSNGDAPVRNLYQSAVSLNYQPFPLLTLSIGYVHEKGGEHGLRGGINLAYYFATPLSEQITPPQCGGFSFLPAAQLHRLVMRDNNIRLEYRKQQVASQTIARVTDVELLSVTGEMSAQTGETNGYAVSAVIRDQFDQILSYQDVIFATSAPGAEFHDIELVSDQNGFVRTRLTSSTAGQVPFTIATAQDTYRGMADFMAADDTAGLENLASDMEVVADGAYANGTYSNTVRVTLTDTDNNPLPGKTIQFFTAMEELTISPQNGGITDAQGQALADLTTTRAGIYPVSASFQSHTLSERVLFVADSTTADLNNAFSSITQEGSPALADGTATIVVTATLKDAFDNPVPGEYVTFQDTYNLDITPLNTLTDDNGQVIANVTTSYADIYNVVASYNGGDRGIDVQFLANTATAVLTLSETGSPAEAGDNSGVMVTAQLLDGNDNPIRHQLVTFSPVPELEITPLNDLTDKYGQMLAEVKSSKAGPYTVSATYNDNTASVAVTFIAGAPETISLVAAANNVVADNVTTTEVTATVLDTSGNPVGNVPVSFTVPSDAGATLGSTAPVTSNSEGLATTTVRSLQSGILVVTGAITPQEVEVQATTEITFVADESTADLSNLYSSIVANGSPAPADGSTKIVVMATLKDGNNNPVPGADISFPPVPNLNLVPLSRSTNSNGQVFANVSASKADIYPVTAVYKGVQRSVDVVFEAVADTAGLDKPGAGLAVTANHALADGIDINAVTATLTDANGNPVPDQQIAFPPVEGVTITPENAGLTNAYGQVMTTITSTRAATYPITASYNGQSQTVSVEFLPGAATVISLADITGPLLANDTATANVVATVVDANGNGVGGEAVTFQVPTDAGATLGTNTPVITNGSGLASTTIRGNKAGAVIITATTPAVAVPASTTVLLVSNPGTADITNPFSSVTEVGSPAMADDAEQIVVTATLKDANGNPVAGETVTFPDVPGLTIVPRNTETNVCRSGCGGDHQYYCQYLHRVSQL